MIFLFVWCGLRHGGEDDDGDVDGDDRDDDDDGTSREAHLAKTEGTLRKRLKGQGEKGGCEVRHLQLIWWPSLVAMYASIAFDDTVIISGAYKKCKSHCFPTLGRRNLPQVIFPSMLL